MQKPGMSWLRLFILALAGAISLFGQVTIVGGNNQFALVDTAFGQQLQVKVGACSYNCPPVNVTFQVGSTAGYQNLYFCGTAGCTTGSSVLVKATLTVSPACQQRLEPRRAVTRLRSAPLTWPA